MEEVELVEETQTPRYRLLALVGTSIAAVMAWRRVDEIEKGNRQEITLVQMCRGLPVHQEVVGK